MRCIACNVLLDNEESSNKGLSSGEYLDMCRGCIASAGIVSQLSVDIENYDDIEEDWWSPDDASD